jgi:two-component system sensor histidine kinase/response regulator
MSQEVQDLLFNLKGTKSQQGTQDEAGFGLGLLLCAEFVETNGGRIWFESKQGEGSTFYFSVPLGVV